MQDLCTVEDLKAWLGESATLDSPASAEDALKARLVSATSADFLRAINRPGLVPETDYVEVLNGHDSDILYLSNWPVNSVASVAIEGVAVDESSDGIEPGWYLPVSSPPSDPEGQFSLRYICGWFARCARITVTYNAGYAETPADVEQAVIEWAAYRYRQRQFIGQTSKHLQTGETVSFQQFDVPPSVQTVIDRYRNSAVAV